MVGARDLAFPVPFSKSVDFLDVHRLVFLLNWQFNFIAGAAQSG